MNTLAADGYEWGHGIAPRQKDAWRGARVERGRRLSVTFRFRAAGAVS